ncbi:MAG TPA: BTAD domain-containing putative transcriptional regulator [Anaerolineae bacterium]|nr:BTAD domain-containing putative transcriptional regulator [Anaerolineae bacterium]
MRAEHAGQPVQGFESRRALALLCYLAAQGQPQPRAHLADLFWPDKPEARGRGNLSRVLHNFNALLPNCVSADRETVTFNVASCWLDISAFTTLTRAPADAAALTEAVALYRDDFMAGMYLDDCPEFEMWLVIERERWRQQMSTALHLLLTWHTQRGEIETGLDYTDRLLALDPWREEAHRHKMLLLALAGQRSAALKQYEQCCQILANELGVSPTPETEVLHQRLLDDATLDAAWLPSDTSAAPLNPKTLPLVGRADTHAWLLARWDAARRGANGGLTLLAGPAGIGKTRLMHEVTRFIAEQGGLILAGRCYEYNRAVPYQAIYEALRLYLQHSPVSAWASLPSGASQDLAWLFPELCASAPRQVQPERATLFNAVSTLLRTLTQPRPGHDRYRQNGVLFLDDLHWADADTLDLLHYLVHSLADVPFWLVGTYRPEETPADHPLTQLRRDLDHNGLLDLHTLPPLTAQDVIQLTHRLFTAQDSASLAAYLYQESAGNPFIIAQILSALREKGLLTPAAAGWEWAGDVAELDLPARVQDLIVQRTEHLDETSLYLLTLAAAYGRPFDSTLLAEAGECAAETAATALTEWHARQLVRPAGSDWDFTHDKIRSALYQSIPAPLRRLLHARLGAVTEIRYTTAAGAGDLASVCAYHFDLAQQWPRAIQYLRLAAQRAQQIFAQEQTLTLCRRGLEIAQTHLAGHPEQPAAMYDFLCGLETTCDLQSRREEQQALLHELADLVENGPAEFSTVQRQIEVALRQAHFAEATSDYATAAATAQRAVSLAQMAGDDILSAAGLRQWGYALRRQELLPEAHLLYERARATAERAGAKTVLSDSLQGLANVAWNQGNYAAARDYLGQSLALCQELGDRRGEADVYNILGIIAQREGNLLAAQEHYTHSLELRCTIGDRRAQGLSHNNLGSIAYELGDYVAAETAYTEAMTLCHEANDRWGAAIAALGLSWAALDRGEFERAQRYAEEGLVTLQQVNAPLRAAQAEYTLGLIAQAQGDVDAALAHITQATATWRSLDRPEPLIIGLSALAQLWAARRDTTQARAVLAEALSGLEHDPLPPGVTRPLRAHWHCYQALVALDDPRAVAILERARGLLQARAAQLPASIMGVFLNQIPEHRGILATSNQQSAMSGQGVKGAVSP